MKKLCKRMLALVIALVLVAGTFTAIPAFGDVISPEIRFRISILSPSAAPGQYVNVVLSFSTNLLGFNTFGFSVAYDSDILQSVSVTPGNVMTLPAPPSAGENPMQLNFYSPNPLENFPVGTLEVMRNFAVIRFRIHDNAPSGPTPITITGTHAYWIGDNLDLTCFRLIFSGASGVVNVCPPYCECLNCANESDLPNLIMIDTPLRLQSPVRINRWQAHVGDLGLPTTVDIVMTSADPRATASVSWGPLRSAYPDYWWNAGWQAEFYSVGTVALPDNVTNNNAVSLMVGAWVGVGCRSTCDCPICEYEAWLAEIERQQAAYEEWRAWEAAVAQAQADYEAYLEWREWLRWCALKCDEYREWRAAIAQAEAAHQAYLDWLAEIERQRVAYEEWRDWLCATNQCGGCDRCN